MSTLNRYIGENLGKKIKLARTALDLSQLELSKETGVSQSKISRIEVGTVGKTDADGLERLVEYLEIGTEDDDMGNEVMKQLIESFREERRDFRKEISDAKEEIGRLKEIVKQCGCLNDGGLLKKARGE